MYTKDNISGLKFKCHYHGIIFTISDVYRDIARISWINSANKYVDTSYTITYVLQLLNNDSWKVVQNELPIFN